MSDKNTKVTLEEHHLEYARSKVASGEFGSVSEVIEDALRRMEQRDAHIERLRELVREGEESGPPEPFDFDDFLKEMHADYKGAA
jgi:antitoxin ParD1/3/4